MKVEININDYISEEEKKDIAKDVFRQQIKTQLFKSADGTIQSDAEIQRIIGNISHEIVFKEVQKYIPDYKTLIDKKVKQILSKDLSYHVFRKKDAWEKKESLAISFLNEEIKANEKVFKEKIRETIANYDLSDDVKSEVSNKFSELAESMYSLSDLFHGK